MKSLLTLALSALPAFAAFPNGYTYCKVVTTQHAMVSGASDLTNYPLTVILTDADLKTTGNGGLVNNANGYDIGFYPDCSGSGTALKWEMESYSPTTGAIVAHVLRPTLSHTTNDTIGMYYGGGFSTFQSTASAAWDANYKGVWHFPAASLGADSTGNNNGTPVNAPTADTGVVDGAVATQYLYTYKHIDAGLASNIFTSSNSVLTVSFWAYPANIADGQKSLVLSAGSSAGPNLRVIYGTDTADNHQIQALFNMGAWITNYKYVNVSGAAMANSEWHAITVILDVGALSNSKVYFDGALASSTTGAAGGDFSTYSAITGSALMIGGSSTGGFPIDAGFEGKLDDVRISNIARDGDWILTEYRNQSAPGAYISTGPRIGGSAPRFRHRVTDGV